MRFPPRKRLRHGSQFEAVRQRGKRIHCGAFIFQAAPGELEVGPRIGIITSRKVGTAVVRNRARRIFRALFQRHHDALKFPLDIVIVVRSTYQRESFAQLESRFTRAISNINRYFSEDRRGSKFDIPHG